MPLTLITGATGGIGREIARVLSGHRLILTGRDEAKLASLRAEFPQASVLPLDLRRPESFEAALQGLGPVTTLIHNAGVVDLGRVADQAHGVWSHTLAVNVVAPAELTRLLLPGLRAECGHVVFVNSGAGLAASPGWGSYAASKFALRALADSLRAEEAGHGVRVTSVFPGRTATDMQCKVRAQEGAAFDESAYLRPESVAATVRFVLESPRDADLTDVTVRPGAR